MSSDPASPSTPNADDVDIARRAVFLTGPTASGKSTVGIELARLLNAEILSMDSMAVYRGMDIGTAKPACAEQQQVRHHLIDLVAPSEEFSLPQYLEAARQAAADIISRGKTPLFVGGTPLYLTALLRGVDSGPPPNWEFREHWQSVAEEQGSAFVHDQLRKIDPATAERLPPADLKRVIRALEVYEATGRSISDTADHFSQPVPREDCRVYWLNWPREELNERINARVVEMFENGWAEEVRRLQSSTAFSRTAGQAVGYRQLLTWLSSGGNQDGLIANVQTATRRFAKRQRTWLRGLSECRVIEMNAQQNTAAVAQQIAVDVRESDKR